MGRHCKKRYLTEEQKKLAANNINFVWWYIDTQLIRKGKIEPKEIDDVAGYLIWYLCVAAEGFNPDLGFSFASYLKTGMKSGFCRYKQLEYPYREHFLLTDFAEVNEEGDCWHDFPAKEEYRPFAVWEDIKRILDFVDISDREEKVILFYYNKNYDFKKIGKMLRLSTQRAHQIHEETIGKLKDAVCRHNIKMEDVVSV